MRAEALIVHLGRSSGRRLQVDALLNKLPLPAHVLEAVDGLMLSEADVASVYRRHLHAPRYPFALRAQEIGAFLSHRKAWATVVERGWDAGLIVEDDVDFDGTAFGPMLDFALKAMKPGDYIRFPFRNRGESGRIVAQRGGFFLVQPRVVGLGMQTQLVGRGAAARLLDATARFDRPVDTALQMHWSTGVRMLTARPVVIRELGGALGGTTVQRKSKALGEVLSREVRRALYRLRLRLASPRAG